MHALDNPVLMGVLDLELNALEGKTAEAESGKRLQKALTLCKVLRFIRWVCNCTVNNRR